MALASPTRFGVGASLRHAIEGLVSKPRILDGISVQRSTLRFGALSIPSSTTTIPLAIPLQLPGLISEIWESILRAVPKKKSSYSRKRKRQLTGKALQDITALVKCPSCGEVKRAHCLCPGCFERIKRIWLKKDTTTSLKHDATA